MQHFHSSIIIPLFALALTTGTEIQASTPQAEYKLADQNFYLRASVVKAVPSAVILRAGEYRQEGDSYFITAHHKAPQDVYIEVVKDWLEPITPPSMPDSLGLAPDVMQIREPQGDVQVAPPTNTGAFVPATEGMPISNGEVVRTGKDGTAAVLFGGINSARLAPNSEALVQQTVMPDLRTTRIDLKSGIVFSKVGLRHGEKQDFEVHMPLGTAFAKGTDFVCAVMPDRTDVLVAQGTVRFDQANGPTLATIQSTGKGPLKIIHVPPIKEPALAMAATTQTVTAIMSFIPTVNLKLKTLHDQMTQGVKMTAQQTTYLSMMKKFPCLIHLSLVAPPAPVPAAAATPPPPVATAAPTPPPVPMKADATAAVQPVSTAEPASTMPAPQTSSPTLEPKAVAATPHKKHKASPVIIDVAADGSIHFEGEQLSSGHLEKKLAEMASESPHRSVVVRGSQVWQADRIKTVVAMCHEANLQNIIVSPASGSSSSMSGLPPSDETKP